MLYEKALLRVLSEEDSLEVLGVTWSLGDTHLDMISWGRWLWYQDDVRQGWYISWRLLTSFLPSRELIRLDLPTLGCPKVPTVKYLLPSSTWRGASGLQVPGQPYLLDLLPSSPLYPGPPLWQVQLTDRLTFSLNLTQCRGKEPLAFWTEGLTCLPVDEYLPSITALSSLLWLRPVSRRGRRWRILLSTKQ